MRDYKSDVLIITPSLQPSPFKGEEFFLIAGRRRESRCPSSYGINRAKCVERKE